MKKLFVGCAVLVLFLLTSCGVPQNEYDQLLKEKEELSKTLSEYKEEVEDLKKKLLLKQADTITSAEMLERIEEKFKTDERIAWEYIAVFSNEFYSSKEYSRVQEIADELNNKTMAKLDAKGENPAATINLSKFNKLKEGMSYEEVKKIIGGPGKVLSESGNTKIISYDGEGSLGANAQLMFVDDELYVKSQFGL